MKKILHIIVGLNDGGAEGVLSRLCLSDPKNHAVISLMGMGKYGDKLKNAGVDVYCLDMSRKIFSFKKLFVLYKLIRNINPAIVQTWMYHADLLGGVLAKFAKVPRIYWGVRHCNLERRNIKWTTFIVMKICSVLSYYIPFKIISCSHSAVKTHAKQGYCKEKFVVIQNGYDLENFKPLTNIEDNILASSYHKYTIAMVARFDIQKDHGNLMDALFLLKKDGVSVKTLLVGTNMDKSNHILLNMISERGLIIDQDILLLGKRNDISLLMNSIDLHVLSSLGEAFPNVLAESMACGTLCVSTDVGDAKEIVSDFGWIVPPRDSYNLYKAIKEALVLKTNDVEAWNYKRKQAVYHIQQNFSLKKMVDSYYAIWRNYD